jgi:hypothetical protein
MLRYVGLDLLSNSQLFVLAVTIFALAILIGWILEFVMGNIGMGVVGNTLMVFFGIMLAFLVNTNVYGRATIQMFPSLLAITSTSVAVTVLFGAWLRRRMYG